MGFLKADGQRVAISENTAVTVRLSRNERKLSKLKKGESPKDEHLSLASRDYINLDTFVRYQGTRQADGSVLASKVEFEHAELEDGESKLWKRLSPKVKEANFTSGKKAGELKVAQSKYKLVPDQQSQDYVSRIGESIIPAHQKELPDGSPLKIPFRFYLVQDKAFNACAIRMA